MKFYRLKFTIFSILLLFCLNSFASVHAEDRDFTAHEAKENKTVTENKVNDFPPYSVYIGNYSQTDDPTDPIILSGGDFLTTGQNEPPEVYKNYRGSKGEAALVNVNQSVSWQFTVRESGLYCISFNYFPFKGTGSPILADLYIDGLIPFSECVDVMFDRIWNNSDHSPSYDILGNEILPAQVETPRWQTQTLTDSSGLYPGDLRIYLASGKHTVSVRGKRDSMLIENLTFFRPSAPLTYTKQLKRYKNLGYQSVSQDAAIVIQAEKAYAKSDQTMYPLADRSSPTVIPYNYANLCYNTIGGTQWKTSGQWIEWAVDAKQTGLYTIAFHFKQALKSGNVSVRELYIDGNLPFDEAADLTFPYNSGWQLDELSDSDGNPYQFYLTEGRHILKLKVGLGSNAEVLSRSKKYLQELNAVYRKIVVVTGASPDPYRDYHLNRLIPETIKNMADLSGKLKELEADIQTANKGGRQNTADIKRLYNQLDLMVSDSDTISYRLSNFKDNISSFGTWINTAMGQPLEIDYLMLNSVDTTLDKGEAGFFRLFKHFFLQFVSSFTMDYSSVGQIAENCDKEITVWQTSGRDQAQVLKALINSSFTPTYNIAVNLQLVSPGSLLPTILAGIGPDVSLGVMQTDPMNLSLRKGIVDLMKYSDSDFFTQNFHEYELEPFRFNGGLWALPETLTYPMLFYRKDILSELGIDIKDLDRWDTILKNVLPSLQKSSLSFGVLPSINNYLIFLHQHGGELYLKNNTESGLGTAAAIDSMKEYSMLYSQYGLHLAYDFANRFRSGEVPVAISEFTSYNQLSVFAPEIKGLWGMLPVPGTLKENGTVDHTGSSTVTGDIILAQSSEKEAAWTFLKWWMSADIQTAYGKSLESIVGSAARYNSANIKALESVPWDSNVRDNLIFQSENLKAIPEVPGGYFTNRLYDFAFRDIIYSKADVRETLNETVFDINREMYTKRKEYNLN